MTPQPQQQALFNFVEMFRLALHVVPIALGSPNVLLVSSVSIVGYDNSLAKSGYFACH